MGSVIALEMSQLLLIDRCRTRPAHAHSVPLGGPCKPRSGCTVLISAIAIDWHIMILGLPKVKWPLASGMLECGPICVFFGDFSVHAHHVWVDNYKTPTRNKIRRARAGRPQALQQRMADNGDSSGSPTNASADEDDALNGHGHFFVKKTFHKPTYCHHCTDILWGLIGVGYVCEGE